MTSQYPDILDLVNGYGEKYRADCAAFNAEFQRMLNDDETTLRRLFIAGHGSATMPHSGLRVTWEEPPLPWWQWRRRGRRAEE